MDDTFESEDRIYQDGKEDLAHKVIHLIRQSDYTISAEEIEDFLEFEIGWHDPDRFQN